MTTCTHNIDIRCTWTGLLNHGHENSIRLNPFAGIGSLQTRLVQWQAIRKFQSLDDQSLQDIGIERYEIRDFVRGEIRGH